jgi:LacI family transcriptional regulator
MNELKQPERDARVTIRTVAADAGVSVAAVSKVLRNAYGVSEALRGKVMESIERLEYRPSVAARGMRGQTYTIGVLLVEIANPFLPLVVDGINATLAASNYKVMIGIGQANVPIENSLIDSMIDAHMDGLILVAPLTSGETIGHYSKKIPLVTIAHHSATATTYDTVNGNDQAGARLAVEALIAQGQTDIMMVTPEIRHCVETGVIRQREMGYMETMARNGLADRMRILRIPNSGNGRDEAIRRLLTSADRPRAIFAWSDIHGVYLINHAKTMGIDVPRELAIVAYDNSMISSLPLIDLASVDQSGRELGAIAAELLLGRIDGRAEPRHVLVEPALIARSSLCPGLS